MPKIIAIFPMPLLGEMDKTANSLGMNRSQFLRWCCEQRIQEHEDEKFEKKLREASDSGGLIPVERVIELLRARRDEAFKRFLGLTEDE